MQIIKRIDTPRVDHLPTQCVLVVRVYLLNATVHKVRVDFHEPLQITGLTGID